MAEKSIGFVGTGNMAEAMIRGLLRGDVFKPKQITASAPREERQRELAEKYGIRATAIARGEHARESDLEDAKRIFDAVGITVVLDESLLDAVTGLSGSGPAYVFLILEALSDAGVKVGLSRRSSQLLAAQTLLGSAKLLLETNEHPGRLKDMVTSPGGTAITGLHTLENGGVRTTLMNAVEAATKRSKELGEAMLDKGGASN